MFVHGTAGFRSQSLEIVTHWASRGFVHEPVAGSKAQHSASPALDWLRRNGRYADLWRRQASELAASAG